MNWSAGPQKLLRSGWFEYFYRIFLTAFAIIAMLGGSLYFYFSSLLQSQAVVQNGNTLSQLKNAQEAMLEETDRSISGLVLDAVLSNYGDYYRSQDYGFMIAAQSKLNTAYALNSMVDSIYIYYKNENLVLSSDEGPLPAGAYYDSAFQAELNKVQTNEVKARVKTDPFGTQRIPVVSFINTNPIIITTGSPHSLIVYNLKSEALQQSLDSIKLDSHSTILIVDKDGTVITQKAGQTHLSDQKLIGEIKARGGKASGSFITSVGQQKTLVSYINSSKYSWRYICLTPMSAVTAGVRFLGVITGLFCALMIGLAMFTSMLLSRKLYSPITAALALFNPSRTERGAGVKETVLLQSEIDTMLRKNKSLEELLREFDAYQRDNFLKNLLEEPTEQDHRLEERLQYYRVALDADGWFVTYIISIDNARAIFERYSEKQINMLSIYIEESVSEKLFSDRKGFYAGKGKNGFYLSVNYPAAAEQESIRQSSREITAMIREQIGRHFKFTFTIGVSLPCAGIASLHETYEEALTAVNHRLLVGYDRIIFYETIAKNGTDTDYYPFPIEKKILDAIKAGNRADIVRSMDEFTAYVAGLRDEDTELMRYYFMQLLTASIRCFYEIDRGFGAAFIQKEYYAAILKEETIHKMALLMKNIYNGFLDYMEVLRDQKETNFNRETVRRLTAFISDHLESDLSLESLADRFQLSPYQLRKLFRDELNSSPKEYIDQLKIARAEELLCTTSMTVEKIAESVGYFSKSSFMHAFKTATGKTPGEFRQDAQRS